MRLGLKASWNPAREGTCKWHLEASRAYPAYVARPIIRLRPRACALAQFHSTFYLSLIPSVSLSPNHQGTTDNYLQKVVLPVQRQERTSKHFFKIFCLDDRGIGVRFLARVFECSFLGRGKSDRGVKLTTPLHLVPVRKVWRYTSTPPFVFMAWYLLMHRYYWTFKFYLCLTPSTNPGGGRDFRHLSRPALGPIQPPVKWVLGLSRG